MSDPTVIYKAGNMTIEKIAGNKVWAERIEGVNVDYVFSQEFMQENAYRVPLALNAAYSYDPDFIDFLLVNESSPQDMGGGWVKWTRTYAKVPDTNDQPSSMTYSFIGFYGVFGATVLNVTGRDRFIMTVPARVQFDYFLLGTVTYPAITDIPILYAQKYYVGDPTQLTDYLADKPPFDAATTPSRTEYQAMITAGTEIVAQDSTIRRWLGNIIERQTVKIIAQ